MIIGDGDIAGVLPKSNNLLFFASGVSNSRETDQKAYERERELLMAQDKLAHIVYFSSLAIFYSDTLYTRHKRLMERVVKANFAHSTIIRLGNITWGTNPHTLINYLKAHPKAEIRDEYRYVIEKPEFLHWIGLIPDWSCEINCPGRMMKVKDIVKEYCVKSNKS